MIIVVVGDCNLSDVEAAIKQNFASLAKPSTPLQDPDYGHLASEPTVRAKLHINDEGSCMASFSFQKEQTFSNKKQDVINDLCNNFFTSMLGRRFDKLAKKEKAPFISASIGASKFFQRFIVTELCLVCSDESQWKNAVELVEQEIRRSQFGFLQEEIIEESQKQINAAQELIQKQKTILSSRWANAIVNSISNNAIIISPEKNLELVKEVAQMMAPDLTQEVYKSLFTDRLQKIWVEGNGEKMILNTYKASSKTPVSPQEPSQQEPFAYTKFGPTGTIQSSKEIKDLGVEEITFSNGVRVFLKKTDFQQNTIHILTFFGNGELDLLSQKKVSLSPVAKASFVQGGLEKHSIEDLERIFADKSVNISFSCNSDNFCLFASTTQRDYQDCCNIITAYITAPGYRPEALIPLKKEFEVLYDKLNKEVDLVFKDKVQKFLACNDPRFGFPPKQELLSWTSNDIKQALAESLKKSPMDVIVVGDFVREDIINTLLKTLGALPKREGTRRDFSKERIVPFPSFPSSLTINDVDTKIDRGVVSINWKTVDGWQINEIHKLHVLAEILSDRIRIEIRQKMGNVYSPFAFNSSSYDFPDRGLLIAKTTVAKEHAERVLNAMESTANSLLQGISNDELQRAKAPILASIRDDLRSNNYWIQNLSLARTHPEVYNWIRTIESGFQKISLNDINDCAKRYIIPGKNIKITVLPKTQ